jgi:enediyne biosynthesis protein E4
LLLKGDGKGGFEPVPGQESGIAVYGEQRGAATSDFDNDGRPDLVVTQNGAETKLYRNLSIETGLRVRLSGPPENRDGIGCVLRLKRGTAYSAAREIHAGSGYWSQDSAVIVLTPPKTNEDGLLILEVRWPGGNLYAIEIPGGAKEYTAAF